MSFYREYFKKTNKEATEYKIEYLKSVIIDNKIYKFILFNENQHLNDLKISAFENEMLWFSYYKFLNDNTEFEIKYDVNEISKRTNKSPKFINFIYKTMTEVYDICSFSYEYHDYMWTEYANSGNGICLVFNISDLDMLFPIDYVRKDTINFTELIIQSLNNSVRGIDYNEPMGLLPFVVKNPYNGKLDSSLEKEVRILYSPFDNEECNDGIVLPNIKTDIGHKGINVGYADVGVSLNRIILGNKCEHNIIDTIQSWAKKNNMQLLYYEYKG